MTSFDLTHLPNLLRTRPNVKNELYMPLSQTIILLKLKHEWQNSLAADTIFST